MWEGGPEVCAVDRAVSRGFGRVDVFAASAVEFDGFFVRDVAESDWEKWLRLAEDAWTTAKVRLLIFFELCKEVIFSLILK